MTRKEQIERQRDLERWQNREQKRLAQVEPNRSAARLTEALAWCAAIIARNERNGLSVGC